MKLLMTSILAAAALCSPVLAQDGAEAKPAKQVLSADQIASVVSVPFAGNEVCPVSGKPVKQTVFAEQDQKRIYTCCAKCKTKAVDDFDNLYAKAYPADTVIELKNTTCPISGKPTDDTDESVVFQGHKVNLCCEKCLVNFNKNPQRFLVLLKNPELKPLNNKMCVVSSDEEVAPGSFFVYKNMLIDTCCSDCADDFAAAPQSYLKKFKQKAGKVEKGG